jgi:MOSC domain-containing protein YiiM
MASTSDWATARSKPESLRSSRHEGGQGPLGKSGGAGEEHGEEGRHHRHQQAARRPPGDGPAAGPAYAREDYDWWERRLDRTLASGLFGENLTLADVDVNGATIGESWRIGDQLVLQTTFGRIPCATFQAKMAEPHWVKTFARENRPGSYLRVLATGDVRAGDTVEILDRPAHGVTIAAAFHAWMTEPARLVDLLHIDGLPEELKAEIRSRLKL